VPLTGASFHAGISTDRHGQNNNLPSLILLFEYWYNQVIVEQLYTTRCVTSVAHDIPIDNDDVLE